jgi:hypothetical protein
MNRKFSDDVQIANKYIKKCSLTLAMNGHLQEHRVDRSHLRRNPSSKVEVLEGCCCGVWDRNANVTTRAFPSGFPPFPPPTLVFCWGYLLSSPSIYDGSRSKLLSPPAVSDSGRTRSKGAVKQWGPTEGGRATKHTGGFFIPPLEPQGPWLPEHLSVLPKHGPLKCGVQYHSKNSPI